MISLEESQPFTTLIPQAAGDPILLFDGQAALRFAIVDKEGLSRLDKEWEVPGIYCLLYPQDADGSFLIYVGKASANGLKVRVSDHVKGKEGWVRALLVAGDTTFGFNSTHVGWLEGRLWSVCKAAEHARLVNNAQPGDPTLPPYERAGYELKIPSIKQALRLLGYSLEPGGEIVASPAGAPRAALPFAGIGMPDLLKDGFLKVGDVLEFTWKGFEGATATVSSDGGLVMNGNRYPSLSAAGQAIRHGAVNGWEYWAVRDEHRNLVSMAELRSKVAAKRALI